VILRCYYGRATDRDMLLIVVFMTICASRMHLGLSAALHGHPHDGLAGDREQQLG
jgi:hypothetical protein